MIGSVTGAGPVFREPTAGSTQAPARKVAAACPAKHGRDIGGPYRPGQRLTVLVVPEAHDFEDLTAAASNSLDFRDNPLDAEDWNGLGAHS